MGYVQGYSGYLIEASQLANLTKTVAGIEEYASKEAAARAFANTLKAEAITVQQSGGGGAAAAQLMGRFMEMLNLTKVSSTDINAVNGAVQILLKYKDADANFPSAAKNSRLIIKGIADTLVQITPEMMYSAMVN
jgi:lysyl-tRNA synthetase class II